MEFPNGICHNQPTCIATTIQSRCNLLEVNVDFCGQSKVLWIANNEGASFWLCVMSNLRNRDVKDILIAVVDGLKGLPDAINAAFAP